MQARNRGGSPALYTTENLFYPFTPHQRQMKISRDFAAATAVSISRYSSALCVLPPRLPPFFGELGHRPQEITHLDRYARRKLPLRQHACVRRCPERQVRRPPRPVWQQRLRSQLYSTIRHSPSRPLWSIRLITPTHVCKPSVFTCNPTISLNTPTASATTLRHAPSQSRN